MGVTVEGFYMSEERDETGLVRAVCWQLYDMKSSYSYATLCKGWNSGVGWRRERLRRRQESIGVVDEGIANVVVDPDYDT